MLRLACFGWQCPLMVLALSQAGCTNESVGTPTEPPPPTVGVSRPLVREVADVAEFTGRTGAPFSVEIRSRVTGFLVKEPFVEGSQVKQDQLLFEIDPRPYQATVDQATSDVALNKAKLKLAKADNARAKNISKMNTGAVSQQDLDTKQANEEQADAALLASQAQLESATINLEFTKITSPIDGRVSRYNVTIGNLVNADSTLLTTVVSEDPMYAYFDIDELTMLTVSRRLMKSKTDSLQTQQFPVFMGLADEEGYPHKGYLNFANNVVSNSTGTLTVRGAFPNPAGEFDRRLLRPGMFVRIRLPISPVHPSILVAERAINSDQGRKFLYVLNDKNVVEYRPIVTGPPEDDALRVVESGLKADERVVVSGLQLVRAAMAVKPEDEPMILPSTPKTPPKTQPGPAAPAAPAHQVPATSAPAETDSGRKPAVEGRPRQRQRQRQGRHEGPAEGPNLTPPPTKRPNEDQ
ncbi:MAG TPA: efflux RND transporter periplasmic adaptor subunit [Planctomycetaceae bacterium]|jgi:multidrug efflux system membrane fusion protein|nr:efflux RND transporter periplasmic adaptor subunit [Planctomycetaceae bacterium]